MKINKPLIIFLGLIIAVIALIFLLVFLFLLPVRNRPQSTIAENNPQNVAVKRNIPPVLNCVSSTEEKIIRGSSLSGLIEDGKTVRALFGYYLCNEPQRGEVVLYHYAGDKNPLIKVVRAVPGDTFHLLREGGSWRLAVNGKALVNAQGIEYQLDGNANRMLSLYERDYHGVIPPNTYLLLGNLAGGSLDSTHFGLVDKSDILAKVEYYSIND